MMKRIFPSNALQKKKILVVAVGTLLIIATAFWLLLGDKGTNEEMGSQGDGLNTKLPGAHEEGSFDNKLSFYDQAARDSIKLAESIRNDPYYKQDLQSFTQSSLSGYPDALNTSPGLQAGSESSEKKLLEKLAILEEQLQEPSSQQQRYNTIRTSRTEYEDELADIQNVNQDNSQDPQLKQMEGMLDKILDIQHPDRIRKKTSGTSLDTGRIFKVNDEPFYKSDTGFYGFAEAVNEPIENAFQAVIHQTQTLMNGSVVKLRLLSDVFIDGVKINAGNFLYGFARLNNERLEFDIHSINTGRSIYPVNLEVYDLDGLLGINIPGAITRDVAKQSADNSLQLLELSTMDPSLKAQATAAGIQTAKNLLSKKVRLVKVVVKAGYKLLLKNKN